MGPSPAQIERVAESLVRRLVQAQLLEPTAPEETIRARFAAILGRNFEEEAEIEREAKRARTEGFSLDGRLDQLARARMPKRAVPGSREWDVLYRRYYEEERRKLGG